MKISKFFRFIFLNLFFLFIIIFAGNDTSYLIDYAFVKVIDPNRKETLIHQKIKIENEKGKRLSHLQIPIDQEREKFEFIDGFTILPSGKKIKILPQDIKIVTPAEFTEYTSLYPGFKIISINFPGVEIGCIIEYKYKIISFKPLIENHFWDGFFFQSTEPFIISRYELKIPKRIKIQIYEKDVKIKEQKEKFGFLTYIWEKRDMPGIVEEILMPPLSEIVPKVYVSTFTSWQEIGKWFHEISKDERTSDELLKTVKELIKDKKTEEEKIASLYHYVCSKIRYVGLEMGIHGYKPHPAVDVFKVKYGDCKDKANLLKKMLEIAGIKSYLALVNTERNIEENIPFPGQFNHAIISIPYEQSYIFLDPTTEVLRFPDLPSYEQGKYSLICSEKPELFKIPIFPPDRNLRERKIIVNIDSDGNLKGEATVIPKGIFEGYMRNTFRFLRPIERERKLNKELNSILPSTKLLSLEINGLEDLENQLIEKYSFYTHNYGIKVGNKLIFYPALLEKLTDLSIVSLEERHFPLRFGYNFKKIDRIEYILPENINIEAYPDKLIELKEDFGKFFLEMKKSEKGLIYERILEVSLLEIPIDKYEKFKEFYQKVSYYDKLPVILSIEN